MRTIWTVTAAALALTAFAGSAEAQTRRAARAAPPAEASPDPGYGRRGYDIYSRQSGSAGTIRWNTPNASGNLGGPSTGGGGGGP